MYSLWQATMLIVGQLSLLGAPQVLMRDARKDPPIVGLVLHSLMLAVIWTLVGYFITSSYDLLFGALVFLGAAFLCLYRIGGARAKREGRFSRVMVAESLVSISLLFAILVVRKGGALVPSGISGYWVAALVEAVVLAPAIIALSIGTQGLRKSEIRIEPTREMLGAVYSVGALASLDILLWSRIEMYFLGASPDGLQGVAVFGLSIKLANILMLAPAATIEAWYPQIASAWCRGIEEYRVATATLGRKFAWLFMVLVGIALPTCLFIAWLMFGVYRDWFLYICAVVSIRVICGFAGYYSAILYSTGREVFLYLPVLLGGASALLLNWAFTTRYGLPGVVMAYAITQILTCIATIGTWRFSERRLTRAYL